MTEKKETLKDVEGASGFGGKSVGKIRLLRAAGFLGVAIAAPFFIWVPLGLIGLTPSMIDVFGIVGLRFPAAVTISGLLLAAIGFHEI